jgi:hypothetical protein
MMYPASRVRAAQRHNAATAMSMILIKSACAFDSKNGTHIVGKGSGIQLVGEKQ